MKLEPAAKYKSLLRDQSGLQGQAEDILLPKSAREAAQGVLQTGAEGKKLTFQGRNTGVAGGAVPGGGRLMNFSRMTDMGVIQQEQGRKTIEVSCGVTLEMLNQAALAEGCFLPGEPTEKHAAIGGAFAAGSYGPDGLGYGDITRYILRLDWLTPKGELWHILRGKFRAHQGVLPLPNGEKLDFTAVEPDIPVRFYREGMDLIEFLYGSEGWFGACVSLKLELLPLPENLRGGMFFFGEEKAAFSFARQLKNAESGNTRLCCCEYMDRNILKLLGSREKGREISGNPEIPAAFAVYAEFSGSDCDEYLDGMVRESHKSGGMKSWTEETLSPSAKLRRIRSMVPVLLNGLTDIRDDNGGFRWETDFQGPEEQYESFVEGYREILRKSAISGAIYGHLTENRLHVALLPENEQEKRICSRVVMELGEFVVKKKGWVSSEYGVGRVGRSLLKKVLSQKNLREIRRIIEVLDPNGMMNP